MNTRQAHTTVRATITLRDERPWADNVSVSDIVEGAKREAPKALARVVEYANKNGVYLQISAVEFVNVICTEKA